MKINIVRSGELLSGNPIEEKSKSKTSAWRNKNPEKAAALKVAYREKQRISDSAYYARNREEKIAWQLEYATKNAEAVREKGIRWRINNTKKVRLYIAQWRMENQESCRRYKSNRRARIIGNGGQISKGIESRLMSLQNGKCACCGADLKKTKKHLDHVIPLARGGANSDKNVQLLCARCNLQKKDRCPVEFMQSRGFLL